MDFLSAAKIGKTSIVKSLFLQNNSVLDLKDCDGNTALILASKYSNKKTVQIFVKNFGADIYQLGYKGRNCFANAVIGNKENILKYLYTIDKSLANVVDEDGNDALLLSATHSKTSITQLLLESFGVNLTTVGYLGRNVFHQAIVSNNLPTIILLKQIYKRYPLTVHNPCTPQPNFYR